MPTLSAPEPPGNPDRIFISIGPFRYVITVNADPLSGPVGSQGGYVDGRRIVLAPPQQLRRDDRFALVLKLVRELWKEFAPVPWADATQNRANQEAAVLKSLFTDLEKAGGPAALVALAPWQDNHPEWADAETDEPHEAPKVTTKDLLEPPGGRSLSTRRVYHRWNEFARVFSRPETELTLEEFGPFMAVFQHLRRAGVQFDPTLCALVNLLWRQAAGEDGESDEDYRGKPNATAA